MHTNTTATICAISLMITGCAGQASPGATRWLADSRAACAQGIQSGGMASCATLAAAQRQVDEETANDSVQKQQIAGAMVGTALLAGLAAAAASGPHPGPGPGFQHYPPPLPPPPPPPMP